MMPQTETKTAQLFKDVRLPLTKLFGSLVSKDDPASPIFIDTKPKEAVKKQKESVFVDDKYMGEVEAMLIDRGFNYKRKVDPNKNSPFELGKSHDVRFIVEIK